jgi:hypothetical protein
VNRSLSVTRAIVLLTLIAVMIRVSVFLVYQPVTYPDSSTYFKMASYIHNLDFHDYKGWRTPSYPLLLLLAGQNHYALWGIQSLLGVLISLLLFWICLSHTGSVAYAFLAGLLHSLALNELFFEANVLTETLSTFLIVLSVASLASTLTNARPGIGMAAGFFAALATLSRPLYIYLGPTFIVLLLLFKRDARRLAVGLGVLFLLPVFGGAAFNKVTIDYFGLSTQAGLNLSNHSGRFMEKAGDQHAMIRDVFLKHRAKQIAETGHHQQTFWLAREELLEKTGFDDAALSRELTKISLELFARYPMLYLRGVAESWASYWAAPLYIDKDKFTLASAARVVGSMWAVERMFILLTNFLAIAASGCVLIRSSWRRLQGSTGLSIPLIISCVIVAGSVLQAFVEFGENPRYGIPTQSLALTLVLLAAWDLRAAFKAKAAAGPARSIASI